MKNSVLQAPRSPGGFTLVEMSMSMAIITVVTIGMFNVFISFVRSYNATSLMYVASTRANLGLERMVYGGANSGLREALSSSVALTNMSGTDWKLSYSNQNSLLYFQYLASTKSVTDQSGKTICTNVISATASNLNGGAKIMLSVAESGGGRIITNTVTTFVEYRN